MNQNMKQILIQVQLSQMIQNYKSLNHLEEKEESEDEGELTTTAQPYGLTAQKPNRYSVI